MINIFSQHVKSVDLIYSESFYLQFVCFYHDLAKTEGNWFCPYSDKSDCQIYLSYFNVLNSFNSPESQSVVVPTSRDKCWNLFCSRLHYQCQTKRGLRGPLCNPPLPFLVQFYLQTSTSFRSKPFPSAWLLRDKIYVKFLQKYILRIVTWDKITFLQIIHVRSVQRHDEQKHQQPQKTSCGDQNTNKQSVITT